MTQASFDFALTGGQLTVTRDGAPWRRAKLATLPAPFLAWQTEARMALFQRLERGEAAGPAFAPHLPTLATFGGEEPFLANLVAKGMGLLPRAEALAELTEAMEQTVREVADHPWAQTLPQRLAAARLLYGQPRAVDPRCLGGLEIFETTTFRNLRANPAASLLYVGPGPVYPSFQFDGLVQIVEAGDPRYRFLRAVRGLFEREGFHFQQPGYPWGYLFWVVEVKDKTLQLRKEP